MIQLVINTIIAMPTEQIVVISVLATAIVAIPSTFALLQRKR